MNFVSALELILPVVDDVYSRWKVDRDALVSHHTSHPEAPQITCSDGCGACCYFPIIPATAGEAFVLIAKLLADGHTLEELSTRFSHYSRVYFDHARKQGSLPLTDEQQRLFMAEKLPCPLFQPSGDPRLLRGSCGQYEKRPLICDFFHSVEDPALCWKKAPHGSYSDVMERGHDALEEIRAEERRIWGRSALGHLPLLAASLLTDAGFTLFLTPLSSIEKQENSQDYLDFSLYLELLDCLGYQWGEGEWASLAKAQSEVL
jgi:Fe-S-cluster containining protein